MKTYDIDQDKELYLSYTEPFDVIYNVKSSVDMYIYTINTSGNIVINLNKGDASIRIHYSTINEEDNNFKLTVNHNYSNTKSNVYNHGINIKDKALVFDITGNVPKSSSKCIVNQENQIININNGNGTIKPNLLIDNYDVTSTHAAYIGNFKEDKLYYLMSRGIKREDAIKLLMKSMLINNGNEDNEIVKELLSKIDNL